MNENLPVASSTDDRAVEGSLPVAAAPVRSRSPILLGIFTLLLLYTLYFARDVLVPIVIAVLLNQLLGPVVHRLKRLRVPEPLGAALVLLALIGGLGYGGYALSPPAGEWIERAPQIFAQLESKLRAIRVPVEEVQRATEKVEDLADMGDRGRTLTVTVKETTLGEYFVVNTTFALAQIIIVLVLLYFLLASGDLFMRRFVKALSTGSEKRQAVEIVRGVQQDVATYLATVTLINSGLGLAVAAAMALLGMPNPVLWGVMAALMNFIPYVGALMMVVVLAVVALLSFDEVGRALAAPGIFFLLTNIEANFVTPAVLGRRLILNPAFVFVSLVVWSWLWGVPGAILAVPILVAVKTLADHIEPLSGLSIFLGRRENDQPTG